MKNHICFYKSCIILCICCCLITLSGCRPEMMDNSTEKSEIGLEEYKIDNSSIKTMLNTTPKHIKKNVGKNVLIDAEVIVPDTEYAPIIKAKKILLDEESLVEKFFRGKETQKQAEELKQGNKIVRNITYTTDNEYFRLGDNDAIYLINNVMKKYQLPTYNREGMYELCDVYLDCELDFMSKSDVVESIKDILNKNGISTCENPKVYGLSQEKMQQEQDKALAEDNNQIEAMIDISKVKKQDKFIKDDECYAIFFKGSFDNIPIVEDFYVDEVSDKTIFGSSIEAWISKDGIIDFNITNAVEKIKEVENPEKLLSVDDAMDKLKERYDNIITDDKMFFNEISFQYVCNFDSDNNEELNFVPTWCFVKRQKQITKSDFIRVNAVTGEVF